MDVLTRLFEEDALGESKGPPERSVEMGGDTDGCERSDEASLWLPGWGRREDVLLRVDEAFGGSAVAPARAWVASNRDAFLWASIKGHGAAEMRLPQGASWGMQDLACAKSGPVQNGGGAASGRHMSEPSIKQPRRGRRR